MRYQVEHTNSFKEGPRLVVRDPAPIDCGRIDDVNKYELELPSAPRFRVFLLQLWSDQRCVPHLVGEFDDRVSAEEFARQQWAYRFGDDAATATADPCDCDDGCPEECRCACHGDLDPRCLIGGSNEDFETKKYAMGICYEYLAVLHPDGALLTGALNGIYAWRLE